MFETKFIGGSGHAVADPPDVRQAQADCLLRRGHVNFVSIHSIFPGSRRLDPKDGSSHISAPGPDQPGHAQDFAPTQFETYVFKGAALGQVLTLSATSPACTSCLGNRLLIVRPTMRRIKSSRLTSLIWPSIYIRSVPQHCHSVSELE